MATAVFLCIIKYHSTMKALLTLLTALLSLAGVAPAATIALSGRITNGIQPPPDDPFLAGAVGWTLHAYWFTVTAPTTITYTCASPTGQGAILAPALIHISDRMPTNSLTWR